MVSCIMHLAHVVDMYDLQCMPPILQQSLAAMILWHLQGFHEHAVIWKQDYMAFTLDGYVYNEINCACVNSTDGNCGSTNGWYALCSFIAFYECGICSSASSLEYQVGQLVFIRDV